MGDYWIMKECPVCGKEFLPAPQHGWLVGSESCSVPVCSYTCQRKYEKTHKGYKTRKTTSRVPVRIIETGEIFKSIEACANHLNADVSSVRNCIYKSKAYKGLHIERVVE